MSSAMIGSNKGPFPTSSARATSRSRHLLLHVSHRLSDVHDISAAAAREIDCNQFEISIVLINTSVLNTRSLPHRRDAMLCSGTWLEKSRKAGFARPCSFTFTSPSQRIKRIDIATLVCARALLSAALVRDIQEVHSTGMFGHNLPRLEETRCRNVEHMSPLLPLSSSHAGALIT